jgi:AcrR family transcriptional regulator
VPREPAQTRQRARRSDSVRNSELVTAAAIEMFARHGKDVTLAQVAAQAGVGKATVYRTYAAREDMVAAMLEHRLAWMRERMERAAAGSDGWAEFAGLVRDVMERMRRDRFLLYVVVTPPSSMNDRMGAALGPLFLAILAAAKESGRVRADVTGSDLSILMSGTAAALAIKEDFESASWQRAAGLILAACASYPPGPALL